MRASTRSRARRGRTSSPPRCTASASTRAFALEGEHNRRNALAAIAATRALDVQLETIAAGLASVRAVPGRLQRTPGLGGATLIDDSYNANPASALAALEVLGEHAGERHLVLGDMAELGGEARALHAEIGTKARELGVHALWSVGPLAAAARLAWESAGGAVDTSAAGTEAASEGGGPADGGHHEDLESLIAALAPRLHAGAAVLVKGSRRAGMERVAAALGRERDASPVDADADIAEPAA